MNFYVTADTHLGHNKYRSNDFQHEIYRQMSYYLRDEDVLIHLGDVCMGKDDTHNNLFTRSLKGKKWLVKGNHDNKTNSWYIDHGWDFVGDMVQLNMFGKVIFLTHCPMLPTIHDSINIHGHLHDPVASHRLKEVEGILSDNHVLVSIEGDQKIFNLKKLVGM